jgi:hypothetical protein
MFKRQPIFQPLVQYSIIYSDMSLSQQHWFLGLRAVLVGLLRTTFFQAHVVLSPQQSTLDDLAQGSRRPGN